MSMANLHKLTAVLHKRDRINNTKLCLKCLEPLIALPALNMTELTIFFTYSWVSAMAWIWFRRLCVKGWTKYPFSYPTEREYGKIMSHEDICHSVIKMYVIPCLYSGTSECDHLGTRAKEFHFRGGFTSQRYFHNVKDTNWTRKLYSH